MSPGAYRVAAFRGAARPRGDRKDAGAARTREFGTVRMTIRRKLFSARDPLYQLGQTMTLRHFV
jgi:hypothetical protein